jgi:hypothetical protein
LNLQDIKYFLNKKPSNINFEGFMFLLIGLLS